MSDADTYDKRFDRYNTLVGRIATLWAEIEFSVNDAIWELANVDAFAGACITSQIVPFNSRMRALISLVHFHEGSAEILRELNRFGSDAEGLSRQRNRYIHDPAGINSDGVISRINITADRRVDMSLQTVDYDAMVKLGEDLRDAMVRFKKLYEERVLVELPPWPRTQYEQSPGAIKAARGLPNMLT